VKLVHLVSFSTREAVPVFAMKVQEQLRCSISTVRFTTGVHWMDWVYPRAGLDALRNREISYVFRESK